MSNYKKIKQSLKKRGIKGIALDVDETLSFTAEYWVSELSRKFGNPEGLSPREVFQKYRLIQNYPHWQTKEVYDWMEEARTSNELQKVLPLIENSNHFVNKINEIVPITCYITARPYSVLEGTSYWLEKHGFPKADILIRPENMSYEEGTSVWKAKMLAELYPQVLGIVDDNPSIIDHVPKNYKGYVFLYDFPEYISTSKNIFICPTWEDVLTKVKELF